MFRANTTEDELESRWGLRRRPSHNAEKNKGERGREGREGKMEEVRRKREKVSRTPQFPRGEDRFKQHAWWM